LAFLAARAVCLPCRREGVSVSIYVPSVELLALNELDKGGAKGFNGRNNGPEFDKGDVGFDRPRDAERGVERKPAFNLSRLETKVTWGTLLM
jgi:hypothetical protein